MSGYATINDIYPDDRSAIVVFTNIYPGAAGAPGQIAERIGRIIFAPAETADARAREIARRMYEGLTTGTIDRAMLTTAADAYFTRTTNSAAAPSTCSGE